VAMPNGCCTIGTAGRRMLMYSHHHLKHGRAVNQSLSVTEKPAEL
jgi:hypothetical protein